MDPEEVDDTGVFSPPVSQRNITINQDVCDKEICVSESDGTDLFSPDVSFRSRFVRSLNSPASKENTPPHTETPSITKQLEGIERKGAKRKQHFSDALNSQHSTDDSYNKIEGIFDDLESQEVNPKRNKRFHMSTEESASDSKSEDTGVFSLGTATSSSQDEAKTKRKSRFEVMDSPSFQDSEDSLFTDVFGCSKNKTRKQRENQNPEELNIEGKTKRKPRFEPPASSEESLQYSAIFNFASKDKNKTKPRHGFVMPSSQNSDESRYSDILESIFDKTGKPKRNTRFATSNLQQSEEENSCYSDSSLMRNEVKVGKKHPFVEPASPNEESISYSNISAPQNESNVKKNNHFVDPASQETENSLGYSNILLSQNETNVEKITPVIDPTSQEIENSLGYSNLLPSQNESNIGKPQPFVDPASQGIENSLGYSNILPSQNESNVEKIPPFIDPASQGIESSLGYSNILPSQNESKVERRQPFINPASQDIEDSQYSEISISIDGSERPSRFAAPSFQNSENSITQEKCEKTSSTNYTSIRSICIDTVRGSLNVSTPSIPETTGKPINLTYDVSKSVFCQEEIFSSSVDVNFPDANDSKNYTFVLENSGSPKLPVVSNLNASCERTLIASDSVDDAEQSVTLMESKIENSSDQESSSAVNESENQSTTAHETDSTVEKSEHGSADVEESSLMADESENQNSTIQESGSVDDESEKENTDVQEPDSLSDGSKNESATVQESILITDESKNGTASDRGSIPMTNESEKESATVHESIPITNESKNESVIVQKTISMTDESKNIITSAQEFTPVVESIMIDTIPNSSNVPPPGEKFVEESVYVDLSPSNLMLSVTVVEAPSNNFEGDFSVGKNKSNQLAVLPLLSGVQNNEPPSTLPSSEENIKEHDYAAIQISNASLPSNEEIINKSVAAEIHNHSIGRSVDPVDEPMDVSYPKEPVAKRVSQVPITKEISKEAASSQVNVRITEEIEEQVQPSADISCREKIPQERNIVSSSISEARSSPTDVEIAEKASSLNASIGSANRSLGVQKPISSTENEPVTAMDSEAKSVSNGVEIANEAPSPNASARTANHSLRPRKSVLMVEKEPVTSVDSEAKSTSNDVETAKKSRSPNASPDSANRSLRPRRSVSKVGSEPVTSVDSEAKSTSNDVEIAKKTPSPNASTRSANRSSYSQKSTSKVGNELIPPVDPDTNLDLQQPSLTVQDPEKSNDSLSRQQSVTSIDPKPKSNYSLRSKNSRSYRTQKSPEPVPSTSAAVSNSAPIDNTGDGLFHLSDSVDDTPSRNFSIISSSRSRNSTSSKTFASRSSISVFSKSKIGRPSTAQSEFKVPEVPKVVPKKKKTKKNDQSFAHLPSKPNFPKFDFYCNKRFYDYLTSKLEPKYGIRTNNEAVKLAQYISDVVKEVVAMKTDDHHILIEEMKIVLFRKGIVTTHYNFYLYCFDYLPPWFRRKAIPMMVPKGCPPRVKFDLSLLFDSIE